MGQIAMFEAESFVPTHVYVGDKAARAYGSVYVGMPCRRAGPWIRGKALMEFADGRIVAVLVGNGRMRRLDANSIPAKYSGEVIDMAYIGDPRWLNARFLSSCSRCGAAIAKGARIFYYPSDRTVLCVGANCGEQASLDFEAARFDEGGY